jgi:polyisoprenoid-binding protein YceI
MPKYDSSQADCFIFTFKEGLLSPMAHDLRIKVTSFSIEVDDAKTSVVASFDTTSLRVDTPMKDGAENPSALSAADKEKIAGQIRDDVLHSSKHPTATFRSSAVTPRGDGGYDLAGDLTLHGVTKRIQAQTQLVGGRQQLDLTLNQPEFGITPYKAMLGTLKIQPDVKIRVTV